MFKEENAVEMVVLVLNNAGEYPVGIKRKMVPVAIKRLHGDLERPANVGVYTGDTETAFLVKPFVRRYRDDLRIDEKARFVLGNVDDEQPLHTTDLRSGETDPLRVVHRRHHIIRKADQVIRDGLYRRGGCVESFVGVIDK